MITEVQEAAPAEVSEVSALEALARRLELATTTWRQRGEVKALRRELLAVLAALDLE